MSFWEINNLLTLLEWFLYIFILKIKRILAHDKKWWYWGEKTRTTTKINMSDESNRFLVSIHVTDFCDQKLQQMLYNVKVHGSKIADLYDEHMPMFGEPLPSEMFNNKTMKTYYCLKQNCLGCCLFFLFYINDWTRSNRLS